MEKSLKVKLIAAGVLTAVFGGGYVALSQVHGSDEVVIGVDPYPPFLAGRADEKTAPALLKDYAGFEAQILQSRECSGIKFRMKGIKFDNMQQELDTKSVDVIAGGPSVTKERQEKGAFTVPYGSDGFTFVSLTKEITKDNIASMKVIVQAGSVADDQVTKEMKLQNVVRVGTAQEIASQLQSGLVDAAFVDTPTVDSVTPKDARRFTMSDKSFDLPYAFYGRQNDSKLKALSDCTAAYLKNHPEFTIHPVNKQYN